MIRVGVDAMGGDYAPQAVVRGAVEALAEVGADCRIVLFGNRGCIEAELGKEQCPSERFDIVDAKEVIGMDESPANAFYKKPCSSITVGFAHLKTRKIEAFASAGSTGAMMVGSMYVIKQIEGIIRPAISSEIPVLRGGSALLLDVGLNVDCRPDVLYQYGIIGNLYARLAMGIDNPRVALLNIGEEREKGNLAAKETYKVMEEGGDFNFVGNIEGKHIFTGDAADVIVCDGFVGNTVLKQTEGFYEIAKSREVRDSFIERMNYELVGGTPVLGINSTVIIGHGCSSPLAIKNMILQTEKAVRADIPAKLKEILN